MNNENKPGEPTLGINEYQHIVVEQPHVISADVENYPTKLEVERGNHNYNQDMKIENRENVQFESRRVPIEKKHAHPHEAREIVIVERPIYFGYVDPYPTLSKTTAWMIFVINLFLPGIGTMIVACLDVDNPSYFILSGFFQLITVCFIIGYIMAIWTSAILILKSK